MKQLYASIFLVLFFSAAQAQNPSQNGSDTLQAVSVKSYLFSQPVFKIPAAVSILGPAQLKVQADNSMVSSMNTIPGVKMEERSPGSYRLSLRGSLLRSPFGVRDVKVYFDELPLTDAGGNTYLNALDINSLKSIEVLKGPDGSLFGANSGGVVILRPTSTNTDNYGKVGFNGGSYNLLHQNAALQNVSTKNQFNFDQSYQSYGGYREHSYMRRHYFQAVDKVALSNKDQLKILALYADLKYQTPGGITFAQMNANPTLSRQATPTLPSAIAQDIQISTKVLLGGAVNEAKLTDHLKNVTSLSVMHVDFANPFITNYEQRLENTYSLRSYFELDGGKESYAWKLDAGLEWQKTNSGINNYANNKGVKGNEQKLDKINSDQHFFFGRYSADILTKLHLEAALSLNYYKYDFKNIFPLAQSDLTRRKFDPQLMPRLALSYEFIKDWAARASVSRGYSTPTTAEVRPTDNVINTDLQAQTGWNYEAGLRMHNADNSLTVDAAVFNYRISDAIVRRLHPDDTEYYINAGGTDQTGIEVAASDWIIRPANYGFVRGLQLSSAYTLSRYFFRDYADATTNYSGKPLTGVPRHVVVSSVQVKFPEQVYIFVQHNYTAGIPLNDANTVFASQYHLLQAKVGWSCTLSKKNRLELYAGADNILNQRYSLGNDLNAVGNRYYNPSPLRNYYAGFNVIF